MRSTAHRPASRYGISTVFLCTCWLTGAGGEEVEPTSRKISPLALEYRLLAHLAKKKPSFSRTAAKRAFYMRRYGRGGYTVRAVPGNSKASSSQRSMRKAAYVALTGAHLRAAASEVKTFTAKYKIKIRPGKPVVPRTDRTYPIQANVVGVKNALGVCQAQKRSLQAELAQLGRHRSGSYRAEAVLRDRLRRLEAQISRLKSLSETLHTYIRRVDRFVKLADGLRGSARKESLLKQEAVLVDKARLFAQKEQGIKQGQAVGTQQVRWAVTAEKKRALASALSYLLTERGTGKVKFFSGKLPALPSLWPLEKPLKPAGDFHVTEFVQGGEVFLTVFDTSGLWCRIVALEFEGTVWVHVPADPQVTWYQTKKKG